MIPYGKQDINQQDIDAVVDALNSDFLTQGPKAPAFEQSIKTYCGVNHALAVNSATSALHIACLALGVGPGDMVWTTPITFVASANCALYCGAEVDFVDIDSRTYNLSPSALEKKLATTASIGGKLPSVIIPVHLCGQPCDMAAIKKLSDKYGFKIIEDASHAIGGRYLERPIGNCDYSDITVFSFHPVKIITTAEGGVATTNNQQLADKMALYRSHGITRDPELMTHEADGPWYYQQVELGFNYRMTELQAALGCSQMQRLDQFVTKRHDIARRYDTLLSELPVITPYQHSEGYSGLHLYVVLLDNSVTQAHLSVFNTMRELGVGVNLHYIPVHTQPYYQQMGFKKGDFPKAEAYYKRAISLPMHTNLTLQQQDEIVSALKQAIS